MPNDTWTREDLRALRLLVEEPVRIRITGSCMAPRLQHGDAVWVCRQARYWPGDVLVARSHANGLVAHRLIGGYRRRGGWRWMTQADRGKRPDCTVSDQDIVGRVVRGDCAADIVAIPLRHRLWAWSRFARFAVIQMLVRPRRQGH